MTNVLKISVIVPIYKAEKYLDRCIQSIVNQSYTNLEIILVDDGSPDNSPAMCDQWASKDSRIKVVHQTNSGVSAARNTGLDNVSGDYFMFVDSDDYMDNDMVEFLLDLAIKENADLSRCGFYFNYENANQENHFDKPNQVRIMTYNQQISDLVISGHISGVLWNKLYKTSAFSKLRFDTDYNCNEDMLFNYQVFCQKIKSVYKDDAKYHYFIHDGSITNSEFTEGALSIIWAKQKIMAWEADNKELQADLIKGYIISCFAILNGIIKHQKVLNKYDYLRNEILTHKKQILFSNKYSKNLKIKTILLWLCPSIYSKFVK